MNTHIKGILEEYKYKTELHTHTFPASKCADIIPEDVIRIYSESGVDSVVITNHINLAMKSADKYLSDFYRAREAGERYGVDVILGVEIVFTENRNDYLIYGVEEDEIAKMISFVPRGIKEFYREFKNDKNVILQAHPFRAGLKLAPLDCVDGIETFNMHPGHNGRVALAAKYVREHDLPVTCGSDFHHPGNHALALVRSRKPMKGTYDIAELIKSRDYLFDLSGHIVFPYANM